MKSCDATAFAAVLPLSLVLGCATVEPGPIEPPGVQESPAERPAGSALPREWACFDYDLEALARNPSSAPWKWRGSLCYPKSQCDAGRGSVVNAAVADLDASRAMAEAQVRKCTKGFYNPWCYVARGTDRADRVYCAASQEDCDRNSGSFPQAPMSACVPYDLIHEELRAASKREPYCTEDDDDPKYGPVCGLSEWHCAREAEVWRIRTSGPAVTCVPRSPVDLYCGVADYRGLDKRGKPRQPRLGKPVCSATIPWCEARLAKSLGKISQCVQERPRR